jgi:hypothetical protein
VRLQIRKGRFRSHVNGMTSDGQNSVAAIVKQTLGCLTLFFTTVKIILIYQCHTGGVNPRQGSKAKDQHGRGLDNL